MYSSCTCARASTTHTHTHNARETMRLSAHCIVPTKRKHLRERRDWRMCSRDVPRAAHNKFTYTHPGAVRAYEFVSTCVRRERAHSPRIACLCRFYAHFTALFVRSSGSSMLTSIYTLKYAFKWPEWQTATPRQRLGGLLHAWRSSGRFKCEFDVLSSVGQTCPFVNSNTATFSVQLVNSIVAHNWELIVQLSYWKLFSFFYTRNLQWILGFPNVIAVPCH